MSAADTCLVNGLEIEAGETYVAADKALTGQSSQFTGFYDDPNHPGCLRSVKVIGPNIVEVKGYDGKEGEKMCTSRPQREDLWSIEGELLDKDTVALDFSSKGGPANVKGSWEEGGIVFPDGNKWSKVPAGTPDRLPKDMTTGSSGPLTGCNTW